MRAQLVAKIDMPASFLIILKSLFSTIVWFDTWHYYESNSKLPPIHIEFSLLISVRYFISRVQVSYLHQEWEDNCHLLGHYIPVNVLQGLTFIYSPPNKPFVRMSCTVCLDYKDNARQ